MGGEGGALGQVGSALSSAASDVGQYTGLSNIGQGIADLFTGGGGAQPAAPGAPGAPPSANFVGPPAPGPTGVGQELVGPPSPYQSPNFLQGLAQGFLGQVPGAGADTPLAPWGAVGGGIGQLLHAIDSLRSGRGGQPGAAVLGPLVQGLAHRLAGPEMAPGYRQSTAPQGGLLHGIIQGLTYGILDSPKMGQ